MNHHRFIRLHHQRVKHNKSHVYMYTDLWLCQIIFLWIFLSLSLRLSAKDLAKRAIKRKTEKDAWFQTPVSRAVDDAKPRQAVKLISVCAHDEVKCLYTPLCFLVFSFVSFITDYSKSQVVYRKWYYASNPPELPAVQAFVPQISCEFPAPISAPISQAPPSWLDRETPVRLQKVNFYSFTLKKKIGELRCVH